MIREIKKKKLLLENRKPYGLTTENYLREIWLSEWIYSSNKLSGSYLNLNETLTILKGDCLLERTIEDHVIVRSHEEAIGYIEEIIEKKSNLFLKEVSHLQSLLSMNHSADYRQNNPVLQDIHYIPTHFKEIPLQMEELFKWYHSEAQEMNPIMRGLLLHNKLIGIYPYEDNNEKNARVLLNYELIKEGFPPIDFRMQSKTYFRLISGYFSKHETTEFYELLLNILFSRLELFLQLTSRN